MNGHDLSLTPDFAPGTDTRRTPITAPSPTASPTEPGDARLWRAWAGWVTFGECVGFGVPAIAGAAAADLPTAALAGLLVAAGAVEGALLGCAQAHVLRWALPTVNRVGWVAATAAGAAIAWMVGLLPMLTDGRFFQLPVLLVVPVTAALGAVLLCSIGAAQWLVLRRQVDGSSWWIASTAAAWTFGLIVFTAVATPLWQPGQPVPLIAVIGLLGGVLMAGTVAVLTGLAIVRLRRQQSHRC
jgi:hypothetical protein